MADGKEDLRAVKIPELEELLGIKLWGVDDRFLETGQGYEAVSAGVDIKLFKDLGAADQYAGMLTEAGIPHTRHTAAEYNKFRSEMLADD